MSGADLAIPVVPGVARHKCNFILQRVSEVSTTLHRQYATRRDVVALSTSRQSPSGISMNNETGASSPELFSLATASTRFRLPQFQPTITTPQSPRGINRMRSGTSEKTLLPACQRCRRLKKKCSRTFPQCILCVTAGVPCSIAETAAESPETIILQARIAWLSKLVNESVKPMAPVESLETGTVVTRLTPNNGRAEEARAVAVLHGSGPGSGNVHDHSGVAAVLASMSNGPSLGVSQPSETLAGLAWSQAPKPLAQLPLDAACRRFVDAYFRHVHRAYPFANHKATLISLESLRTLENCHSDPASTKLYLIMAIGCTTLQRAGQIPDDTSQKFCILYTKIVHQCLENPSMESIETLLLLSLYSLFDPSGLSPWTLVGLLTRQAISLGITREKPREENLSSSEVERHHRVYWSIFVLDRMVSVYMGLQNGFNDDNAEVPLPGVTVEEYGTANRHQHTFSLQISRHVIQLRQLEENILKKIYLAGRTSISSLSGADKRVIVHDLRSQIENWYSHGCLLSPAENDNIPAENDNIPFHNSISWLTVRYYNLLILLHGPSHFNSELSQDQLSNLIQYIQKYVQSSAVLVQQRQLPLNWITLFRFLPICSTLLYCLMRNQQSQFTAHMEVITCAEILESYPPRWTFAARSARIFRAFVSLARIDSIAIDASSPVSTRHSVFHGSETSSHSTGSLPLRELIAEANKLVSEVLGTSSAYCYIESLLKHSSDWENMQSESYSWADVPAENVGEEGMSWHIMGMDFL